MHESSSRDCRALALLSQAQRICSALFSCHVAALSGAKIVTTKFIWGRLLNKEVQHTKTRVSHPIQVICCQHLCNGQSHQWCDRCTQTSTLNKCKPWNECSRAGGHWKQGPDAPLGTLPVTALSPIHREQGLRLFQPPKGHCSPCGALASTGKLGNPDTFWGGDSRVLQCPFCNPGCRRVFVWQGFFFCSLNIRPLHWEHHSQSIWRDHSHLIHPFNMVIFDSNIKWKFKMALLCGIQDILLHIGLALMPVSQELSLRVKRGLFLTSNSITSPD